MGAILPSSLVIAQLSIRNPSTYVEIETFDSPFINLAFLYFQDDAFHVS